jgi:hypothetical protein
VLNFSMVPSVGLGDGFIGEQRRARRSLMSLRNNLLQKEIVDPGRKEERLNLGFS